MKVYAPHLLSLSLDGESFEKQVDGSFDVPEGCLARLAPFGVTHTPAKAADDADDDPSDILVQLAKKKKADIVAYAKTAYNADLDPAATKDALLAAIVQLAAKAADDAKAQGQDPQTQAQG